MTEEIKDKLNGMYNHWTTKISAIGGILVMIGSIAYYGYIGFDKITTALKSDNRLTQHETSQKQQFTAVECKLDRLDSKIEATFDKIDKKLDNQNDKLFSLSQSFLRMENRADAEKKTQASIEREFNRGK